MEKLTDKNITKVVSQTFADTPSERLAEIYQSLVRHLHDFAREVSLTPAEWIAGLGFLTAVGQKCTDKRQEFILLSDVLGLSALVNLLHNGQFTEEGSPPSLVGPFYREGVPTCENGTCIARRTAGGRMARFEGEVVDLQGRPLPGVMVLACVGRRRVRHTEPHAGRSRSARSLHYRSGRAFQFPHGYAAGLHDSSRRPGRRAPALGKPARFPPCTHPFPDWNGEMS